MVNQTVEEFTRILIPSSNVFLHELAQDDWNKTLDVNLNAVYFCMKFMLHLCACAMQVQVMQS